MSLADLRLENAILGEGIPGALRFGTRVLGHKVFLKETRMDA